MVTILATGKRHIRNLTLRDPDGCLISLNGELYRFVGASGAAALTTFLTSGAAERFVGAGRVVGTHILSEDERAPLLAEAVLAGIVGPGEAPLIARQERISFPSFAYEWAPGMLYEAGLLTLDLAKALIGEGLGLKDATPYNILFRGPKAVFVDVLSFERRDPADHLWLPYAQFLRTFILPLLVSKNFGQHPEMTLLTRRDGLEPHEVYRLCSPLRALRPPFLSLVTLPALLGRSRKVAGTALYDKREMDPARARFTLERLFAKLGRTLERLAPIEGVRSTWSGYMVGDHSYTSESFEAKERFVDAVIREFRPRTVLDVGCNTGHFSVLASQGGARVVAVDGDPIVIEEVWRSAREKGRDVLPLVVNVARPTPALGWRNRECPSFLDRACGYFDCVLMLAVVHHLLVGDGIPLEEILGLAHDLTNDVIVLELVLPSDSMFQRLVRGRQLLYANLTREVFEKACGRRFEILRFEKLPAMDRWLYLLRKKVGRRNA